MNLELARARARYFACPGNGSPQGPARGKPGELGNRPARGVDDHGHWNAGHSSSLQFIGFILGPNPAHRNGQRLEQGKRGNAR